MKFAVPTCLLAIAPLLCLGASPARAEIASPAITNNVTIVEHLGENIPLDLQFTNSQGKPVRLSQYFHHGKPVLLSLIYFKCPMLCSLVLNGQVAAQKEIGLQLGKDYQALTVSISPNETPAMAVEKQHRYLQSLGQTQDIATWPFLTGQEPQIRKLADALGYKYVYDPKSQQFAHDAAIFIISPEGKIARYLYGVKFATRDVRLGLVEAAHGKVGTSLDRILLCCFRYDPASRHYALFVSNYLKSGGLIILLLLGGVLFRFWRRESRNQWTAS